MKITNYYPLMVSLFMYWLLTFLLLNLSFAATSGHFGYPLDDTYIHMAIGKHFAQNWVWGISYNQFSSSTSSPLWTFLIALTYKFVGVNEWVPLFLCLIIGTVLLCYIYKLLQNTPNLIRLLGFILLIVLFIPLPILTLTGMEHVLQSFLALGLIFTAVEYPSTNSNRSKLLILLAWAGAAAFTRYETMFLITAITIFFLSKKMVGSAFLIQIAGWLPITLYGLYSVSQGWYFLPSSLLLKGNLPHLSVSGLVNFLSRPLFKLEANPHLLLLLMCCLIAYLWCERQKLLALETEKSTLLIFIFTTLLQLQFADIGWFYRYEAYLIVIGCVILLRIFNVVIEQFEQTKQPVLETNIISQGIIGLIIILFIIPIVIRASTAMREYPSAVGNIYEQQYQMGRFVQRFYDGKNIVANDIGAINYLADINTLDLYGLGTLQIVQARRNSEFNQIFVDNLVTQHNPEIIIIYDIWFKEDIPESWVKIGEWQILNNVVAGDDTVSFYVPQASRTAEAVANLQQFSPLLPETVIQSGLYTQP